MRLVVLLLLTANVFMAQAASLCTAVSTGGAAQGAVFNVFSGGVISASQSDANGACNPWFYNGTALNAPSGGFTEPGNAKAGTLCNNHSASPATPMSATGTPATAQTLPSFQYNANSYAVSYSNSSQISLGGNNYNVNGGTQTINSNGRAFSVGPQGTPLAVPSASYSDWGTLSAQNGTSLALQGNAAGVNINTLSLSGCNGAGVSFGAGNYFIQNFSAQAGCNVTLSDSGPVNLYILNGFTVNGGTSCYNFVNCNNVALSNLAAQNAKNLKIWVYNGNMSFQNGVQMAASLYVQNGSVSMSQGGNFAFVGEMVAQNITFQNNSSTYFYYSPTGSFGGAQTTANYRAGNYALAPAAIPPMAKTGDFAYLAEQQDLDSSGAPGISGHLYAVPLGADGSASASPSWDAASLMTVAQRQTSVMTQNASGGLVPLINADAAAFGASSANYANLIQATLNPDYQSGAWLFGRSATSLMGRPWRTAPVISGSLVVIGDDDGMLYGFDKTTGALVWAFFPRENLPATAAPGVLMNSHPWGQIAAYSQGGVNYITATGMQGALHLALATTPSTGALTAVAWKDYQSGAVSPSAPFGGAAPTMAVDQTGSAAGKVAYIVGNVLTRRALADGSAPQTNTLPTSATSNALYLSDTAAYYGDSSGMVQGVLGAQSPGTLGDSSGSAVANVSGAYLPGSAPGSLKLILLANTPGRLVALTPPVAPATAWTALWQFSAASSTGVPTMPAGGVITAAPTIAENKLYIPVTIGSDPCSQTADEIGPLALLTGAVSLGNTKFRDAALGSGVNALGAGEALFAPAASLNGLQYVFADANGGSALPGSGWGQFAAPVSSLSGDANMRLNWRELTNFFVAFAWPWEAIGLPAAPPVSLDRETLI